MKVFLALISILPPSLKYYTRYVSYYLKIVSDVNNSNNTNQKSFGIGGSCSTPGVADINIPQPNICPGNNITINRYLYVWRNEW